MNAVNAESLIGTVLGTCTLQKLVGQGGMGAVFLAQQSRPKRQVAVKVLLPMTPLTPHQLAAFLERFRRETDAAASMEHPNIVPVHEYGERDGLAYLVMPYISGGTLRDELEREGQLSFEKTANYLEQLAAALEFAHEHGVIHRDIKPANIMATSEGRLLLADFGLVKIVAEGQSPQVRLTGAGAPVGTPDYMAPEQVIGEEIDTRADIYALGVILFQMVAGTTPFHGETPMQIAAQHLQLPPPSPQMWRPDLPVAAEQVILRAMSKRPGDRYMRAGDLAQAFRMALIDSGIQLEPTYGSSRSGTTGAHRVVKGQFDPMRQTASMPKIGGGLLSKASTFAANQPPQQPAALAAHNAQPEPPRPAGGGLLSRTGKFPMAAVGTGTLPQANDALVENTGKITSMPTAGGGLLSRTGKFPMTGGTGALPAAGNAPGGLLSQSAKFAAVSAPAQEAHTFQPATGGLLNDAPTSVMQFTDPARAVNVPMQANPGHFSTGLLPNTPTNVSLGGLPGGKPKKLKTGTMIALVAMAVLIIFAGGMGLFLVTRNNANQANNQPTPVPKGTPNPTATANAQATATVMANVDLYDPLDRNTRGWLTEPATVYAFKDGAYHITNDDENNGRATVLPADSFNGPMGFQLTMTQIEGDDTKPTNSFGMIFRFTEDTKKKNPKGENTITFYSFEVVNAKSGEYQFWKYDNSNPDEPWSQVQDGRLPIGEEFKQGKGPEATNTIKIFMDNDKFTVTVNGKILPKTFQDTAFPKGTVGMIVNLKGSQVAFKDLYITKN